MKIVHLELGRHIYGGARQVLYLLEGLQGKAENILVCAQDSQVVREGARVAGQVRALPFAGEADCRFLFRLRSLLVKERPHLLHVHSRRGADFYGGLAANFLGIPAILSRRVDNPEPRWLVGAKYAMFQRVITISQGIKKVLAAQGVAEDKIVCVPSAVDVRPYRLSPSCQHSNLRWFRSEFSLGEQGKSVGMIAQFIERKGHLFLLQAMPAVLSACPKTVFLFFGQGPLLPRIKKEVKDLGLKDRVRFAGFRHDLERILPCLDLVVHPALLEGLGVSLLQAAAARRPIVAFAAGGIPEVVRSGVNGLLVQPGEYRALAEAMIAILGNDSLARKMGEAGQALVEEEFSITRMVAGNLRVYEQVVGV